MEHTFPYRLFILFFHSVVLSNIWGVCYLEFGSLLIRYTGFLWWYLVCFIWDNHCKVIQRGHRLITWSVSVSFEELLFWQVTDGLFSPSGNKLLSNLNLLETKLSFITLLNMNLNFKINICPACYTRRRSGILCVYIMKDKSTTLTLICVLSGKR